MTHGFVKFFVPTFPLTYSILPLSTLDDGIQIIRWFEVLDKGGNFAKNHRLGRDLSEGWAIGANGALPSLKHSLPPCILLK